MAGNEDVELTHAPSGASASESRLDVVDCLIMLGGEDPGRRIYLDREVVLGRGKDCNAVISDVGISRRHARVFRDGDRFMVEDLGSRNGTRVNGTRIEERRALDMGDEIAIGERTILKLGRRERFEDNLLVAQKMQALGQLAGGIAHDFNNILGALFANVTFLGTKEHDEETTQCLSEMEAAVRRAIDLTRQLSGFGRKTSAEHRSLRVRDLINEGVDLLRRTLPRNVGIEVDIRPNMLVVGDASRLLQVVMNLCINAKDAMPRGGTLRIDAKLEDIATGHPTLLAGTYVVLTFADTGLGIDRITLQRIFEPFFTTKPRGQGTGLGLATVQAILRDHGGAIEVESEVGKGTRFVLHLPSAETIRHNTVAGTEGGLRTLGRLSGLVLVADDDELVRAAMARVLTREGAEVITATDGAEALRRYAERASELRLIILDIDMPRVDGPEALRVLRSFECDLPVIVVSGHADPVRSRDMHTLGISEMLPKPFSTSTLLEAVRRHMHQK